jgi:hypothetical protein
MLAATANEKSKESPNGYSLKNTNTGGIRLKA